MVRTAVMILGTLVWLGARALPQGVPQQEKKEETKTQQMACPMKAMMSEKQEGAAPSRENMMQRMTQHMADVLSLSSTEIAQLLKEHSPAPQLSDAQAEQMAKLIVASQHRKIEQSMRGMMGPMMEQMKAGKMQCPCRTQSKGK